MFFVDSHCHLDQLNYDSLHKDLLDVLNKAKIFHVKLILSVSVTLENFSKMVNFIGYRNDVLFSCGVHPLYLNDDYKVSELFHLSFSKNVIAIGETGLDYHYPHSDKKQQRKVFQDHLDIAHERDKPVIIHSRLARDDTLSILHEKNFSNGGILHCFSEDKSMAKSLLDLNFYISFSGILTFSNSQNLKLVADYVPMDRILLETDSPYLTPVPYRGIENQPAYIYNIAECLANIKGISLDELAFITTSNFFNLFQIDVNKYNLLL
ncbi:YchF/TatD family DNA exonuclease [Blochmannia endosymbiont of Polyrhachis (Hedomyrma) turneri]|uniref:YchF/TatD family DNA exonuclease n=1 Tax=Blochmannia endosymbiont of Polyrhachis (Hedomyrma) turneri TaxID=1505596 RepID=UPI00061A63FD|nr:YchF/TatD family DNA exonuclease [Blochmannia endosymbiont of Polyrhachis (Hedomyrma) turneri]AKC59963.1 putative deoxyribonuclease YcfH [Blochmannia endosymbiont of Polyrhachis (Hedomyrma) turneri]